MIIKKFDTLYTLDSKNKIRIFECEVRIINTTHVATRTGLLNGKLIEQTEVVSKGKQTRSIEEQAIFQADSLWKAKFDEGYKDMQTIFNQFPPYTLDEGEYYPHGTLKQAFEKLPKLAYTNSNLDELPMLAHKLKDIKKPIFPYYSQPKLNGLRCIAKFDNSSNPVPFSIKLCSRGGQYYQISHIQNALFDLFSRINNDIGSSNFLLDGELYVHGVPLQEISGAARKEESGLFASNDWLEYHIYDIINIDNVHETQSQRIRNLLTLNLINMQTSIKIVIPTVVENQKEVEKLHNKFVSEGYEGLILRDPNGEYKFNQRTRNLLKVKQYQDEEFEILDATYDNNKGIGESFVFILKNNINDLTFKSRPTGTEEQKIAWLNTPGLVGKKATVRFFERSKDGLPQQGSVQHKLCECLHIRPYGE